MAIEDRPTEALVLLMEAHKWLGVSDDAKAFDKDYEDFVTRLETFLRIKTPETKKCLPTRGEVFMHHPVDCACSVCKPVESANNDDELFSK
jgi:hypothetical protein